MRLRSDSVSGLSKRITSQELGLSQIYSTVYTRVYNAYYV